MIMEAAMSIRVENLSYIYMQGSAFEKKALADVNLTIEDKEFVGIIGHTGSGKSTLIQHFNGLLKPTSGKVQINGIEVSGKELKELRKHVGLVFQYPEHQLFEETVFKDISFGLQRLELLKDEIDERVKRAIESVGLKTDILDKSPFELSGGQKRRVAIAGVLAMNPKILILDEPTAGLDPRGKDEIFEFISNLHKSLGITVILVSHSMEDIARLVQRVIVISKGKIVMDGSTKEIFSETDKLERVGLSVPQVTLLMKKLKKIVPGINDRVFTIEEAKKELSKYLKG
jgi:energy-coupling factor transport system ATP-binding protein